MATVANLSPAARGAFRQTLRAGRLKKLERLGLAVERRPGYWQLSPELETTLRRMGERGDIIKTLHRELTGNGVARELSAYAIYDPESRMLKGFLNGLTAHLAPGGEGWLILSDIAEHLGLRTREELLTLIDQAGLRVLERLDIRPMHAKVKDVDDPLHAARAAEVTSLWRLAAR